MPRVLLILAMLAVGCHPQDDQTARQLTGGSSTRGKAAIQRYGCGSCHSIPGVPGANAQVGPPLAGIAERTYLAGRLPNHADNMLRWIENPQSIEPGTAMPNLGVTRADARDIAAYLYTLRR